MVPDLRQNLLTLSGTIVSLFGIVTIFMSGSVIFDLFGIRELEGNFVWFVVIVNFICGGFYLLAGYGFFTEHRWTTTLLATITVLLLLTLSGLIIHITYGFPYEIQTSKAMVFRIFVTVLFAGISWRLISRNRQSII